jgi:hypothetical protein
VHHRAVLMSHILKARCHIAALLDATPEDADPSAPIMALVSILASFIVSTASTRILSVFTN